LVKISCHYKDQVPMYKLIVHSADIKYRSTTHAMNLVKNESESLKERV
jgi:hypothetical protein